MAGADAERQSQIVGVGPGRDDDAVDGDAGGGDRSADGSEHSVTGASGVAAERESVTVGSDATSSSSDAGEGSTAVDSTLHERGRKIGGSSVTPGSDVTRRSSVTPGSSEPRGGGPVRGSDVTRRSSVTPDSSVTPGSSEPRGGESAAVGPREVELKYLVRDIEALRAWLARDWGGALDGVSSRGDKTVEVEDRYVDTAYGALEGAGFGARLRRQDGGPTSVTVKTTSHARAAAPHDGPTSGALSQRVEVEGPATDRLDPDDWPPSAARELVNEIRDGARLRTIFTISQRREKRTLLLDEGPVEVALDRVAVFRGGRALASFSVLEVEAENRTTSGLQRLAALLEETGFVTPEPRSKEDIARGYVAQVADDPARRLPSVPRSPGIRADDSLGTAGRKVLKMHLARMLNFEAGTRSGEDVEDLHKMRVSTRRMRAAWRVFDGAYRPKVQRRYERELRGVARALGDVRDLDVLLDGLDEYLAPMSAAGRVAMEPLRSSWRRQRDVARGRLIDRLDSKQYRAFVEDYLGFTETPGAAERATRMGEPSLVRDTAGSRILAAYERVGAYETVMTWADVPTLHALRIEGKRLRYTLEYFAEVLPVSASGLIRTVTEMQDHLGAMNDAWVAAGLTREWLNANAPQLPATSREAVGLYLESRELEVERARRTFRPVWRRVTGRAFRRTLGGVITQIS